MPVVVPPGVVVQERHPGSPAGIERVLTDDALAFLAELERRFRPARAEALSRRAARQRDLDDGVIPGFLVETRSIRDRDWQVAPTPPALERRRVEITGPVDRKMMINAFNSGADAFMADFEDATSPTWENVIAGQANVQDAVRGTLAFTGPDGRQYALGEQRATLILRPRGWHLDESHVHVDGAPMSASLFDFGLSFFHNAAEQLARGAGPYYYLPKLESHLEARLWNDVFTFAQDRLGVPQGSVRVTVLIETILAAFEMDEILYELRDHAAGLNAGRWDYIFSIIKKFSRRGDMVLPDRALVTMTVPFMRAYTELLVRTCHRRGAHAMGGMAAFVPNRRDPAVTEAAVAKVQDDKRREAGDGFDGTWVAHPDLVPVAMDVFREQLGSRPNQKERLRDDVHADANALLQLDVPNGQVTERGIRANVDVALQYVDAWLRGFGAVAIHNLMEDAATAEIARAQLWQWVYHRVPLDDGSPMTAERYAAIRDDVLASLERERGDAPSRLRDAVALLDELVLGETFTDFLTIPAYAQLEPALAVALDVGTPTAAEPVVATSGAAAHRPPTAIRRDYAPADVAQLRGSVRVEHTIASLGAERLRTLLASARCVRAAAATSADEARALATSDAIRIGDAATLARQVADALLRDDRTGGASSNGPRLAPLIVDIESGYGDAARTFDAASIAIEAGAAAICVHDRLTFESTYGRTATLVPTSQFRRELAAARLAADVLEVPTLIIASTAASRATHLTTDVDDRDRALLTGDRASDGRHVVRPSLEQAIARALSCAPYADVVAYESATLDLDEARRFADAVRARFPDKPLAFDGPQPALDLGSLGYALHLPTATATPEATVRYFDLVRAAIER